MIFFVLLMVNSEKLTFRVLTLETSAFCNSLREFMNFISLLLITSLLFYLPVHVAQQKGEKTIKSVFQCNPGI